MRSHFTLINRNIEFTPPSAGTPKMGSHFRIGSRAAMVCAVSGATAMMAGVCSAQLAADYATNPTYAGGWMAGQNGGYGFGAWSFNGTDPTPAGQYQGMSSSSPLGTAWTLLTHDPKTGIANVGRSLNGGLGLGMGETFETVIGNPSVYYFYRGFDILFLHATDNNPGGVNAAGLRVSVFNYFGNNWSIDDTGSTSTALSSSTTAVAGMKLDLKLTSATTYNLLLTPLSNPSAAVAHSGTFAGAGPMDYVDFRLYDGPSGGLTDTANNFEIQYMTIVPEPSTLALIGLGSAGLLFLRRRR